MSTGETKVALLAVTALAVWACQANPHDTRPPADLGAGGTGSVPAATHGSVSVTIVMPNRQVLGLIDVIDRIDLAVTGPNITEPLTAAVLKSQLVTGSAVATINKVPPGVCTFSAYVKDSLGNVIAQSNKSLTVIAGFDTKAALDLSVPVAGSITTTITVTESSPSPTPSTAPTAGGIPLVPASHKYFAQAYDNCLPCHSNVDPATGNKVRFMPFPDSHSGRAQASCLACHGKAADVEPPVIVMTVARVGTAPDLDPDTNDGAWSGAGEVDIPVRGGVNASETTIRLKAVHDGSTVYFRATLADPTESLERQPFVKQADGTWKKLTAWPDKYEDKLAFIWNNPAKPIANFNAQGCAVTCHAVTPAWASNRPLKYTNGAEEYGDIWHAKTARHAAVPFVKQVDDQYVWQPPGILDAATPSDNTQIKAADLIKDGGRKGDPQLASSTAGDYTSTPVVAGKPTWMPAGAIVKAPPFWMEATQSFDDSLFGPGDKLASHLAKKLEGSRGDIDGSAKWANGAWTFEWKRAMSPTSPGDKDTRFEAGQTYYMGAAYFDNNQIGHGVQFGVTRVTFQP